MPQKKRLFLGDFFPTAGWDSKQIELDKVQA